MGYLKTNENQHIGKQELNRLKKFLGEDGYQLLAKNLIDNYGIPKIKTDVNFDNFKVVLGVGIGAITIKSGIAFDKDLLFIRNDEDANNVLTNPNDNVLRYVKISHIYNSDESGTVTLAPDGTLVGFGTKFKEVLRGGRRGRVRIRLEDGNEYDVLSVTDDTNVNLNGSNFVPVSNVKYKVVGTFDIPAIPNDSKFIYQYDSFVATLQTDTTVIPGKEFILASVQTDGGITTIIDRRESSIVRLLGSEEIQSITSVSDNNLIGIEWAKIDHKNSDRGDTLLKIGYGFRVVDNDWIENSTQNSLTIENGSGGTWLNKSQFSDGDFDGWFVHFNNGRKLRIASSSLDGSNIKLSFSNYDNSIFPTVGDITINPDAEFIKILAEGINDKGMFHGKTFVVNHDGFDTLKVKVDSITNIKFSHVKGNVETLKSNINSGTYINENSFDDNGDLTTSSISNVVSGNITTLPSDRTLAVHAFRNNFDNVSVGENDFEGANTFKDILLANESSNVRFEGKLGLKEKIINIAGNVNNQPVEAPRLLLVGSGVINGLNKNSGFGYVWIQVASGANEITLSNNSISASSGNRIITNKGRDIIMKGGESLLLLHDSTNNYWSVIINPSDSREYIHKEIKWVGRDVTNADLPLNWFIADGSNGTDDILGKMLIGKNTSEPLLQNVGNTGGDIDYELTGGNIPDHEHFIKVALQGADDDSFNDDAVTVQPMVYYTKNGTNYSPTTLGRTSDSGDYVPDRYLKTEVDGGNSSGGGITKIPLLNPYFVAIPIQYIRP